jgi:hypothetical protein
MIKYTKDTPADQISNDIRSYNTNLKESSVRQYTHRITHFIKNFNDIDLANPQELLNNINSAYQNLNTRKGLIAPLAKLSQNKMLLEEVQNLTAIIRAENEQNKTSDKEKIAWLSKAEINRIINSHVKKIKEFENSQNPTPYQRRLVKKFVLFLLYCGKFMPPRRITDYSLLLWDYDGTTDYNYIYINGNKFVFNKYKTAATYGQQIINIPKQIMKYINLHRKLNYADSKSKFMFSSTEYPLAAVSINSFLSDIVGKQTNSNIFRKIYISELFKSHKSLKEIKEATTLMGTSSSVALESYNKIDADSLD